MKRLLALTAILTITSHASGAGNLLDGPDADLIYDAATGNVILDGSDTPTGRIATFAIVNINSNVRYQNLLPLDYDEVIAQNYGIAAKDRTGHGYNLVELGNILPPRISSLENLFRFWDIADYTYQPGGEGEFDLIYVPVPEPSWLLSLLAFFLMATSGWSAQRRRAKNCR